MNLLLYSTGNGILQFFTVLIIFIFVIALTYFTTKWIANFQKKRTTGKNIESVEVYKLSGSKYIQILRTGKEYIVIAVCKDSVTLLNKISREDIDLTTNTAASNETFELMLDKIKNLRQKR